MKEIKKKNADDLVKFLNEKREVIRASRFNLAGSAKKNVKETLLARKEIARALTETSIRRREASLGAKEVIA